MGTHDKHLKLPSISRDGLALKSVGIISKSITLNEKSILIFPNSVSRVGFDLVWVGFMLLFLFIALRQWDFERIIFSVTNGKSSVGFKSLSKWCGPFAYCGVVTENFSFFSNVAAEVHLYLSFIRHGLGGPEERKDNHQELTLPPGSMPSNL